MAVKSFSHLVTNAQMKKVLSDVAHLDSTKLGKNYTLTKTSHHACTSGPATWYRKAGLHLTFWNGAQPFTPANKHYQRGKRSATVQDMKASLIRAGFQIVWSGTGQDANTKLASLGILRPGDVATMLSYDSGHAAMWTGEDWRSDFLQDDKPYPYTSVGRGGNETFILWRHPQFQDQIEDNIQAAKQTTQQSSNQNSNQNMAKKNKSEKPEPVYLWKEKRRYPAWGQMYKDANTLMHNYNVNTNIVNQIIQACVNNGLSLNQTAVILANAFQESQFKLSAHNDVGEGHDGVWQFSTPQYNRFGLKDWKKQLQYFMEEVAKTEDESVYDKTYYNKKLKKRLPISMWGPHAEGNKWIIKHKRIWDRSDDIEQLSWAFGEGWERYGYAQYDTESRTQLAKLFRNYLLNTNYTFRNSPATNGQYVAQNNNQTSNQNNNQNNTNNSNQSAAQSNNQGTTDYSNYSDEELDELEAKLDREYAEAKARVDAIIQGQNDSDNSQSSSVNTSSNMYTDLKDDTNIQTTPTGRFNTEFIDGYSEHYNVPGNTHIDYYTPYRNYVNTLPLHLQTGGSLKQRYTLEDTEDYPKSYLIRPTGPFKLPSTALDFEKIVKALFNRRNNNAQENVLSTLYDTTLRNGGKIKKHQQGSSIEKTLSQKEQAKLFKKQYINDLELIDPIYSTKEEDELLDKYYEQYFKIKNGLATYIDNKYKEVDKPILNQESIKRTNWEPDTYINTDDDLVSEDNQDYTQSSDSSNYMPDEIYDSEQEEDETQYNQKEPAVDNKQDNTYNEKQNEEQIKGYDESNNENQEFETSEYNIFNGTKGQFINDFINDDNIIKKFDTVAAGPGETTTLELFKEKLTEYIKQQLDKGIPEDQIYDEILGDSPDFKKHLLLYMWAATDDANYAEPDYNLRNPYEYSPKSARLQIDPLVEMYSLLLDSWKYTKK